MHKQTETKESRYSGIQGSQRLGYQFREYQLEESTIR